MLATTTYHSRHPRRQTDDAMNARSGKLVARAETDEPHKNGSSANLESGTCKAEKHQSPSRQTSKRTRLTHKAAALLRNSEETRIQWLSIELRPRVSSKRCANVALSSASRTLHTFAFLPRECITKCTRTRSMPTPTSFKKRAKETTQHKKQKTLNNFTLCHGTLSRATNCSPLPALNSQEASTPSTKTPTHELLRDRTETPRKQKQQPRACETKNKRGNPRGVAFQAHTE